MMIIFGNRIDDIYDGKAFWLFAEYSTLPETYPEDMKNLFAINPETDIYSGLLWSIDDDWWNRDGVVVCVQGDLAEVQEKLTKYVQEKGLLWLDILYKNGDDICQKTYDEEEKKYIEGPGAYIQEENMLVSDGALNIYVDTIRPGFSKCDVAEECQKVEASPDEDSEEKKKIYQKKHSLLQSKKKSCFLS